VASERRVYTVANVNRGLARRIDELPALWVEGEIGDLRYNPKFGFTFLTLRDPDEVADSVASVIDAGAVGVNLEDGRPGRVSRRRAFRDQPRRYGEERRHR